jgi:hypothetical protein
MSSTYSLVCDDCKVKYWAGQSSKSERTYSHKKTDKFLFDHVGHNIRLIGDLWDDEKSESYEEIETI